MNNNIKNCLLVGASGLIAQAVIEAHIASGYKVYAISRNAESLKQADENLELHNCDITNTNAIYALFEYFVAQGIEFDAVVINSGINSPEKIDEMNDISIDLIIDTNIRGIYFVLKNGIKTFREHSSIVIVSSAINYIGVPSNSAYGMSKMALKGLVKSLAIELSHKWIRVNSIAPGPMDTYFFENSGFTKDEKFNSLRRLERKTPLGKLCSPKNIADIVLFLSKESNVITGQEICIDGGLSLV